MVCSYSACATCTEGAIAITINEVFPDGPYTTCWSNGETTEDITGLLPGIYTVTVTSASTCSTMEIFIVGNSNSVSINENEIGLKLDVYPYPANDKILFTYNFNSKNAVAMTLTNALQKLF